MVVLPPLLTIGLLKNRVTYIVTVVINIIAADMAECTVVNYIANIPDEIR